jgi:hypothetical protein
MSSSTGFRLRGSQVLPLDRRSRASIAGLALTVLACAFASTPLVALGGAPVGAVARSKVAEKRPAPLLVVTPRRDPFSGEIPEPKVAPSIPASSFPPIAPPPTPPVPSAGVTRVTALVTGEHASAVLEENGRTRIVVPGDTIEGMRVVTVDVAGVHLADGVTLPVVPSGTNIGGHP